jgi:2-methylcitrate dehydratase PrpD
MVKGRKSIWEGSMVVRYNNADPAYDIARNIINVQFEDLPQRAIDFVKMEVLDCIGVALAGSTKPGIQELLALLTSFGGKKQSSIIASGTKLPVIHAAQVNASMIHAVDYDDVVDIAVVHPGCVVVASCLALSEYRGKVTGKEFITAIALGVDLMTRMGLATKYRGTYSQVGWHATTLYGFFGAAGATGKLLGLDETAMVNALGIAYHQTSGNLQGSEDGALTKRMGPGFAARGGIMAALMAQRGITGALNCIEGKYGIYNVYQHGAYDRETLLQNLGKDFTGTMLTIKPYPCCRAAHAFVDATLALIREHHIEATQVQEITVYAGDGAYRLCSPLEVKTNPRTPVDSQFSVPWAVAVAIANKKVTMDAFTREAIEDRRILDLSHKIKVERNPNFSHPVTEPGRVKITTNTGTYIKQVDQPCGGPESNMTYEDVIPKFLDCASCSIKPIPPKIIDRIIQLIANLEEVKPVSQILALLNKNY